MSSKYNKDLEDDKYLKIFKHLEAINLRNKASFDELLRYTYNNINDIRKPNPKNNKP